MITNLFKLFKIQVVKRVSIRKINLIDFRISENASDALRYVINPELLSNMSYFPSSELIKQNIQNIRYESGKTTLNLRYGLNVPPTNNSDLGQIILDIDVFSLEETDLENVFKVADSINKEIFNIFRWAISPDTINLLNG